MTCTTGRWTDDRGAVSAFLVIIFAALVGFAGLVYDGGQLFAARREAVNVAAAAARAGANDIDEASIHAGTPELADTATATAQAFALNEGMDSATAVELDPFRVQVEVTQTVEPTFLGIFGIGTKTLRGQADARIQDGVTGDG